MLTRLLGVAIAAVSVLVMNAGDADAKGSSYIVAATVDGGSLVEAVTVPVALPQNLDDMFEREPLSVGPSDAMLYQLTLHYDFGEVYGGKRDWSGLYDGAETLYFPESMVVEGNVWAAGWYTAVEELAVSLQSAISSSVTASALPVSGAGDADVSEPWREITIMLAGLLTAAAGVIALNERKRGVPRS